MERGWFGKTVECGLDVGFKRVLGEGWGGVWVFNCNGRLCVGL